MFPVSCKQQRSDRYCRCTTLMLQVEREDTEDIVSNGLEQSVFCYIAFVAFQAFLIDFTEAKEVWH